MESCGRREHNWSICLVGRIVGAWSGFLAITENGLPVGYNLYVGGGQGQTNSKPDTYPLLAQLVGFIEPDEVVAAAEAIFSVVRDDLAPDRIVPSPLDSRVGKSVAAAVAAAADTAG